MQVVDTDKDQLLENAKARLESARRECGGSNPAVDDVIDACEALMGAVWLSNIIELQPGKHYLIPASADMTDHDVDQLSERLTKAGVEFTIMRTGRG